MPWLRTVQTGNATAREGEYSEGSRSIERQDLRSEWRGRDPRYETNHSDFSNEENENQSFKRRRHVRSPTTTGIARVGFDVLSRPHCCWRPAESGGTHTTTLGVYGHILQNDHRDAVELISQNTK